MKAQQGSIKESSFGQLDACLKHGKYRVGRSGDKICHAMSEVVHLAVEAKHIRVYTLDELKDFESKLVLITGSMSEQREKVDGFLDVSVLWHLKEIILCITYVHVNDDLFLADISHHL